MKLETVINALNQYIQSVTKEKIILVLKRNINEGQFPAYKIFKLELWVLNNKQKYCVITSQQVSKVTTKSQEENLWDIVEQNFLNTMFEFEHSELFNKILTSEIWNNSNNGDTNK